MEGVTKFDVNLALISKLRFLLTIGTIKKNMTRDKNYNMNVVSYVLGIIEFDFDVKNVLVVNFGQI